MLTTAPVANATDELSGTVSVMAAALLKVTKRPLSVSTKVYVVPVWALRVRFCLASLIVGVFNIGLVNVLLVSVSVVALPTSVSVAAGSVSVVVPATAVACTVVLPEVEPAKPRLDTGEIDALKALRSSEVSTCLTVAPAECCTPDVPARALVIVKVSVELAVMNMISSLVVSGSIATVNWSTLPAASVTPPSKAEPVPEATVIVVALDDIVEASVVSTLIDEYCLVISLPYLV
jgi:hypothetical protein